MKKQGHEQFIEYLREILPRYQAEYINRQREIDKVIIWFGALSTGAIALILTHSNSLPISSPFYLKLSVAFFVICILCCAVFRFYIYIFEGMLSDEILGFDSYCFGLTMKFNGPIEILDAFTVPDIEESLRNDMGIDYYTSWLSMEALDRDFWVELYNSWADFWRKSEESGYKSLGIALALILHKSPEETENLFIHLINKSSEVTEKFDKEDILFIKKYSKYKLIRDWSYGFVFMFFCLAILTISLG